MARLRTASATCKPHRAPVRSSRLSPVSAGAFDDAGGDRPAVGKGGWVVQVPGLVRQVPRADVGAFARGFVQAAVGGGAPDGAGGAGSPSGQHRPCFVVYPGLGVRVALGIEAPDGLPQVLEHVDHVDEDEYVDLAGLGLGLDPVELVVRPGHECDPATGVGLVAPLCLVEYLGHQATAVAASSTTLAVSHLLAAVGPARACSRSASVAGRMSATVRTPGVQSWTAPTSATRFRLPFSPLDSRPASFGVALSAALAVAGRSASGRITMPFPSTCTTSTSESSAVGGGLWQV